MRLIVGTYRKSAYISRALASIDQHVTGVTDIVFVDDSGDSQHCDWLRQYGRVIEIPRRGYNVAMKAVCAAAEGAPLFFVEEDFEILVPVDLNAMWETLESRPELAQLALLRGPHFPIEHEHGGLLEALVARGYTLTEDRGITVQDATFTCNPAVWRGEVAASGWPDGKWSEDAKRDELLAEGYRFGFLPGVKVSHDGVRSGKHY